jgi:hypothetical protein
VTTLVLLGLASVGCGGDDGLSPAATAQLQPQVAAIRTAAAAGDRAGAMAAMAQLRQLVAELRATDEITAEQASRVGDAAGAVEAQLALLAPPPPDPTSTTTAPTDDRHRKGKGKDDGKGGD